VYGTEHFRLENDRRAPGTRARSVDWSVSSSTYSLEEHALEKPIADEDRDDADPPLALEIDSTEMLTELIKLRLEYDAATLATTYTNYASGHYRDLSATGYKQWDDFAGSDPMEDVRAARSKVHSQIARNPNVMVIGKQVFEVLKNHPKILARIAHTARGVVTTELLASLFEVDEVAVGGAIRNTAKEGATASNAYVWGKNVVLAYRPPTTSRKMIALGTVFRKQGFRQTEMWRESPVKSDFVKVTDKYHLKQLSDIAGYLIYNVIA